MKMQHVLSTLCLAFLASAQPISQAPDATPNKLGVLPASPNSQVTMGSSGPYTNVMTNRNVNPIFVVIWSAANSFVANGGQPPPLAEFTLNSGQSQTVSFSNSFAGAYAAIYPDTTANSNNQISNTWVEIATGQFGTFDVSREINANGHAVSVTSSTTGCKSDLNTCVFKCVNGATSCGQPGSYALQNCAAGSQPGTTQGGCSIGSQGTKLTTTFS